MSLKKENVDEVDDLLEILMEDDEFRAEYRRHLMYAMIYGRQGFGKNMRAAAKLREQAKWWDASGERRPFPRKTCTYRKPKVYWFGELHGSNNFIYNPGWEYNSDGFFPKSRHWKIDADKLTVKGRDPKDGLSVFPAVPMGSTTGRHEAADPFKGKRFIGVSEPPESDQIDSKFLKRFTGDDEWVETRTYKKSEPWKPLGKIFVMSGQPPVMHNKDKETIERVKEITYTETAT